MTDEFYLKMPDFHVTLRDLLHAANLRHGKKRLYFPSEGRRAEEFFRPENFNGFRPGMNPRTWVPKASTLPLDQRSRSQNNYLQYILFSVVGIYRKMTEERNRLIQEEIVSLKAWLVWEANEQTQFHSTVYCLNVTKVLCLQ